MSAPVDAVAVVRVDRRPGVAVTEYAAACGACGQQLPRLASFQVAAVDYIACSGCELVNVVRRPK